MKLRVLYILTVAGLTLAGYVLVFGELGLLRQNQLERELAQLQAEIHSLKQENENLSQQYAGMVEQLPARAAGDESATTSGPRQTLRIPATILNIEESPESATTAGFFSQEVEALSLEEARILFLTGMFFLAVLGFYGLSRLGQPGPRPELP